MNLVETAKSLATKAHEGQTRRDGVTPYINHPADVCMRLRGEDEEVIAAAWLHDVLEDTDLVSQDMYDADIPPSVVSAVHVLTKTDEIAYERYLYAVRHNDIARKVKIADMLSNLADKPTERQIVKYAKGLLYLLT